MKAIASHNGLAAAQRAYELASTGSSPLDACVAGVALIEDDPEELTVGYGGLPNEDGVVELDAAVMDGRLHRGAGVAALQKVRHPAQVAQRLMEQTTRALLVGEGALRFAQANGFPEENLLTDKARRMWLYWKRTRSNFDDWRRPAADETDLDVEHWFATRFYGQAAREGRHGTVHCAVQGPTGDLACTTSTSGHAFKLAGRVGDSPILGAGLYVDNEAGTCGSIGHGEANLTHLSSFAAVELMRTGLSPVDAGLELLRRIAAKTPEHERDENGRPKFNLQLFLLHHSGAHAGVAMWGPKQIAVCDEQGGRLEDCTPLYER
ncbi:isoaspartyl peptidase/L-asparaginase [Lignipirellula cremea]|uniref:N(4)-(Beta-N-acetylglucosaminyl)-L-asparaginase n=1 Tax=Lignipirellula cremea TaxID=2528010 RepID=A0A518DQQ4_9BACT|nr:isoaspartyl peptidase/L-asparaginase [Lignipirellula cremea]QDU94159.1 N(4)-(Beta-N-acetylglucosaminyl)-L-asparaginase precursor [Lignipirellula cremea]